MIVGKPPFFSLCPSARHTIMRKAAVCFLGGNMVAAYNRIRSLTQREKDEILERDCYTCVYCNGVATVVDHVVPWSWSHCDDRDNLVASCELCNQIASNKIFASINEKSAFIKKQRSRRKFVNRDDKKIARCAWCKWDFRPGVKGASNVLCSKCYKLSQVGANPFGR